MPPPLKEGTDADTIDKRGCERAYHRALKNKRRPKAENQRLLKALAEAIDIYGKDLIREAAESPARRARAGTAA